ncbi:MAG: cobalamin-dependent protein, partial [Deltaproteobacteria bacterium]|nr:cobalamin-dependent protein [Deltaproteobacteria bacterium]
PSVDSDQGYAAEFVGKVPFQSVDHAGPSMDKNMLAGEVDTLGKRLLVPEGKVVILLNTPFTYADHPLCPLHLMSVNTLKLISFLKLKGNRVHFINMRSDETYAWKDMPAGREGSATVSMRIMGKSKAHLLQRLRALNETPDEIWISCIFTFDHEVVGEMVKACREVFSGAKILLGGDSVRCAPELAAAMHVDAYCGRVEEADQAVPDLSAIDNKEYGLFQLAIGCPNRCAFCLAGMDPPRAIDTDVVISYMKEYYAAHHPSVFWNWDPNVLVFGKAFGAFLDKYAASGIRAKLRFGKGFQPNLLTESLFLSMAGTASVGASLPIEAADSATIQRYRKPYTIISSVKILAMALRHNFDLRSSQCTFVLGYPDDSFPSIFRAYLTILLFGGRPTPFPVFLFPHSADYERYREILQDKDLARLHGQLWPLVHSQDVPKYQNLLKFLLLPTFEQAGQNLSLLTPDLRA